MTIVDRLRIATLGPLFLALVLGVVVYLSNESVERLREREGAAYRVDESCGELNELARHFLLHHEERPLRQFQALRGDIAGNLSSLALEDPNQKQFLKWVSEHTGAMETLFVRLVANSERPHSAADGALGREAEEALARELLVQTRQAKEDSRRLLALIGRDVASAERRTRLFVLAVVLSIPLLFSFALFRMTRRVALSFRTFREGTDRVALGDLDRRIGISTDDEIGDLSRAFDLMCERLRSTTVSRDELVREMEARKGAEEHSRNLASFPEMNPDPVVEVDRSGTITYANPAARRLLAVLGPGARDCSAYLPRDLAGILKDWDGNSDAEFQREISIGPLVLSETVALLYRFGVARIYAHNITNRKRAEREREATVEYLRLVIESRDMRELVRNAEAFFRRQTGCESVSVRLRREGKAPEPPGPVPAGSPVPGEGLRCPSDSSELLPGNGSSEHVLDCMCLNVLAGRCDPAKPFFTPSGSFWTNSTTELFDSRDGIAWKDCFEGRCNAQGFESVAILGLRLGEKRLGILQLNDRRRWVFSPESIPQWERLAGHLSVALSKFLAEEALRKKEEHLNRAQEISHLGSWELDIAGNILTWSDEVYRIFGMEPGKFEGSYDTFLDAVHPEDRAKVDAIYTGSLLEGRKSYEIEHRIVRKSDGLVRIVHEKCEHFYDEAGQVVRSVGMVHDITERKKSEEKIRRQNIFLAGINWILRSSLSGQTEKELGKTCLAAAEEMTGSRFGFLAEIGPDGLLHDIAVSGRGREAAAVDDKTGRQMLEDDAGDRTLYGRVLRDGKCLVINDLDGRADNAGMPPIHPGLSSFLGIPLLRGGETVGVLGLANREGGYGGEDLDGAALLGSAIVQAFAGRRAENELRAAKEELETRVLERTRELGESESRFRALVENCPIGIFIVQEGRIVYRNPEQKRLFGPLPEEFELRAFADIHPEDAGKFGELCALAEYEEEKRQMDLRFFPFGKSSDGTDMRWVHLGTAPMEYRGRRAVLVTMLDITRLKEIEHQFLIREKMAALGHVAAGIAHEIRNPLSGINIQLATLEGFQEYAQWEEAEIQESVRTVMEQIRGASNRIEAVIKKVMNFARVGSVRKELADVTSAIKEAVDLSATDLRKNRITLELSLSGSLPRCRVDISLITQVLMNLITNASQAIEEGGGSGRIAIATKAEGDRVVIRISDSGPGIPALIRNRIFDPFFTTRKEGYGIGLSLSHRIITEHGGTITVGSGPLGGAEFRVELPSGENAEETLP